MQENHNLLVFQIHVHSYINLQQSRVDQATTTTPVNGFVTHVLVKLLEAVLVLLEGQISPFDSHHVMKSCL